MARVNRLGMGAVLTGLLLGLSAAQSGVSIYGGTFSAGQNVNVDAYAPRGTVFRLEKVLDPAAFFRQAGDPHKPTLPANLPTQLVKTVRINENGLNLGRLPSGVYLLRQGKVGTVVLVTRLGLVVKRDPSSALVYTADRQTGQVRDAQVWAIKTSQAARSTGGVAKFAGSLNKEQIILARSGDDWALSGSRWNSYATPKWLGYVYSDRPIFRPGQHVDLKGVLRVAGSLKPVAGQAVKLRVLSPDGDEVFSKSLTTNNYGSLAAGFDLSLGAKVGEYRAELLPAGATNDDNLPGGSFQVQEYQKPEYEVKVTPAKTSVVQGEKVSVKVSASYLFGGVPSGAKVTYNVTRAPYYPPDFDEQSAIPGEDDRDYGSDLVMQGTARLDAAGELKLDVPFAKDADGRPVSYRIEAEVEDESRKTVSGQTRVIAYPAAINVQTRVDGYIVNAGKPMTVTLDTRDLNGAGRSAPVTLDLVRQEWSYQRNKWQQKETRVQRRQVQTDANGKLTTTLTAPRGGGYVVRATVKDTQGRLAKNEWFMWVIAPNENWNWYSRDMSVRLDQKKYAPGDTATVLVSNPVPGAPVLLTIEGDKLRSYKVLRGQGAVLTTTIKVTADMSPNIYVGAASLGGGETYTGQANVVVPRPDSALNVKVTAAKARYAPGEKGQFKVDVRNAKGQGVGAELSFGVVDKAIYLIQRDNASTLSEVFGAQRDNVVGTETSSDFYFEQVNTAANAGMAPAPPKPAMTAAAFAQSKSEADRAAQGDVQVRENFKDTIVWLPQLVTDPNGQATVDVTFPDNLTTWVATARAQTLEPRFGQATAETQVTKDVIARLSLPPFLVRGDQATVAGLVNNTLDKPISGTASMSFTGLTPLSGAAAQAGGTALNLAAKARARQDVTVQAGNVGTANVTFTARTAQGSDALKLPLPVKARGYAETRNVVGSGDKPTTTFTLPPNTNPQTVRINLSATPSLLSAVAPALDYLVGYPYGCTEQTMSRFMPALLAKQALGAAALPADMAKDLPAIVDASLARLALFQHEDGGWNFWENDDSTLEMTAYVTEGLLRAKAAGAKVDSQMLLGAQNYLRRHVKDSEERPEERARAYRVLANVGAADVKTMQAFAAKKNLSPYSLAQLSLALNRAGQTAAAKQTLERLKAKQVGGNLTHWNGTNSDNWFYYWDDNSIQVTAVALEALATIEPRSNLIPGISQWLLTQRRGPKWISTQDTTSVIIAALSLPKVAAPPASTLTVKLDGQQVGTMAVAGQAGTLELTPKLAAGQHTMTVSGAPSNLIYAASISSSRETPNLNGQGNAFALNRKYEKLTPKWDDKNQRYTYTRQNLLVGSQMQSVKVGDLILVTVNVKPKNNYASYLLVSDPIPAGMKALDERSLAIAGLSASDEYDWESWNYWYSGRDLRDDRVDLYANYIEGQQSMTYLLRAQTPGTFTALPTHAFLMYDDSVESYGPAATLAVKDK